QAAEIHNQAEQAGWENAVAAANAAAQTELQSRLQSSLPAINSVAQQLADARQMWLQEWQKTAVQLSVKIAERIARREISRSPSITLSYVREALEMCASAPQVRVLLHPEDVQSLGEAAEQIVREIMPVAHAEIIADNTITRGGCRVET